MPDKSYIDDSIATQRHNFQLLWRKRILPAFHSLGGSDQALAEHIAWLAFKEGFEAGYLEMQAEACLNLDEREEADKVASLGMAAMDARDLATAEKN